RQRSGSRFSAMAYRSRVPWIDGRFAKRLRFWRGELSSAFQVCRPAHTCLVIFRAPAAEATEPCKIVPAAQFNSFDRNDKGALSQMRSLNLDQLRAFVEVVERGSFTRAATQLNLSQPAVTHQVQELERRFKASLVERLGKRVYLTQAGEKLLEHARNLLEDEARAHADLRRFGDGSLGRVRVGTSMTVLMYLLPPILRQLKTDHPQLEISLKAGLTATTLQMLKTNALDLGLCAFPIHQPCYQSIPLFDDE